jgi:hypothetical protein
MGKRNRRRFDKITRRTFVGAAGAVAGAALVGCRTDGATELKDVPSVAPGPIVRAAIHPGIGVARIGNSTASDGFFIGPEVVEPPRTQAGGSRDATGALKRQAARFRVYGLDAEGRVVKELTADDAEIQWSVHLANRKPQWYRFLAALDQPEAATMKCARRNPTVRGRNRRSLAIDPGARTIAGKSQAGAAFRFTGAKFQGTSVPLGELRTDAAGRLLVLGGQGKAGSPRNTPVFIEADIDSFNNADGWFDDSSDGPVSATVTLNGQSLPVEPAWVIVAPPNYAPDVVGWRTLHDLLVDTYVDAGMLPAPTRTSFTRDVLPALKRLSGLQWVNKGFADVFGRGTELDFSDPELLQKVGKRAKDGEPDDQAALRQRLLASFRIPNLKPNDRKKFPMIYGDAFGSFTDSAANELAVSDQRLKHLQRWAAGDFDDDFDPSAKVPHAIDEIPLADQPAMLDKAALYFCLADAFHPGCELTWPMRHASMYRAPFRIKARPEGEAEPDFGDELTIEVCKQAGGPLEGQVPGGLTRWMAIPWHGDTVFCRSGYEPDFDPFIPTFWPARVPNHVLTAEDYAVATDATRPRPERLAAFRRRQSWVRAMTGSGPDQMLQMIRDFPKMGVVEARPGVEGDPELPATMLVESIPAGRALRVAAPNLQPLGAAPTLESAPGGGAAAAPAGGDDKAFDAAEALDARAERPQTALQKAGFQSEEQLRTFRRILRLP